MSLPRLKMSETEYLWFSESADEKHEFFNGEAYAMAGGSPLHAAISANVLVALSAALGPRGCRVFTSDLRVHVPDTGAYLYPDVTVACGENTFTKDPTPSLRTPTLVVEVLSPSTQADDRGAKWAHYRSIPSLLAYLMVDPAIPSAELYFRAPGADVWNFQAVKGPEATLRIPPLDITVSLASLMERTAGL